jgi:hypothetical protein
MSDRKGAIHGFEDLKQVITSPVIQGFYLVPVLALLHDVGLASELTERHDVCLSTFCAEHYITADDLVPLIEYLSDKSILDFCDGRISLSAKGRELLEIIPFAMLHFAYHDVLTERIAKVLGNRYHRGSGRDVRRAAEASGLMNAATTFLRVIERLGSVSPNCVVDFGCGDGTFLALCGKRWRGVHLLGMDSVESNIGAAKARISEAKLSVESLSNIEKVGELLSEHKPELAFAFFVFHELAACPNLVERFLLQTFKSSPTTKVVVTECYAPTTLMCREHGGQQFAEFKLFHSLTEQKLLSREQWISLFKNVGSEPIDSVVHFGPERDPIVESLVLGRA